MIARTRFLVLLAAVALAAPISACAQDQTSDAARTDSQTTYQGAHNERFLDPLLDVDEWVERFEGDNREVYAHRHAILEALGLREGMDVADVGAGTGLYVPLLAGAVGDSGTVYAVDIAPAFVEHIREQAAREGLGQVRAVLGEAETTTLPPHSVDLVFTSDTYHHFDNPGPMLASIREALRPGGTFIVVDFDKRPDSRPWIHEHIRGTQAEFIAEIEAAGLRLVQRHEIDGLEENFMLRFVKV